MLRLLFIFSFALSAQAEPMKLALNWKPEPQFGGFYEALNKGHFKKAGLEVTIQEGGSGTPTVQMLANGKVDWAIVSAEEILIANARDPKNPLIAVFATYQTAPVIIMCRAERGFKSIADVFKNPGILAWQNGLTYALYLKKKYPQSVVKTVPYLGGVSNFIENKDYCQQGFINSEPFLAENAGLHPSIFLVSDEGFNPYLTVLAVRKADLDKNLPRATKFVAAVREGWTGYLIDPAATNQQMAKLNKSLDAKTLAKSAEAQKALIQPVDTQASLIGKMTDARWNQLIDQLASLGLIKSKPKASDVYKNL